MPRIFAAALLSLLLGVQGAAAQARDPMPVGPPVKSFSVTTSTIGELLDNPATRAIFQKYLPEVLADPRLEDGRPLTLPDIVQYAPDVVTKPKLDAMDAELKALPPQ